MDRQFVPVPEYLTALRVACVVEDDNTETWELYDIVENGECAFFMFDNDVVSDSAEPKYYICQPSFGSVFDDIVLVPTVHCKKCGQRMKVNRSPFNYKEWNIQGVFLNAKLSYSCDCGMNFDKKSGWSSAGGEKG